MNITKILTASVIILLAVCLFLGVEYLFLIQQNKALQASVKTQQLDTKLVAFDKMFIEKVLQSNTEVSFDDRLKLENAVRDLNDPQILAQWEKFSNSANEADAQTQTKNLLDLIVNKISY